MNYSILFRNIIVILILICPAVQGQKIPSVYIRLNQLGYLPGDYKSGIVLSDSNLDGLEFLIKNSDNDKTIYSDGLHLNKNIYGRFNYSYEFEFTNFNKNGEFYIEISGTKSYKFSIKNNIYSPVVKNLLEFFKIQRCGYTNPVMHKKCHIADATKLIDGKVTIEKKKDLTGGWHDAGDYVKFLNTTAYATYTLLFSYEFDKEKFDFDDDHNNIPDILEEAKIGLDWLLRANYNDKKLVTQIQDLRDHDQGWRLPENDSLTFDRPAFLGIGKNIIGIYSAALALGAKIWAEKFNYLDFSDKCLKTAITFYDLRNEVDNIDSSGTGMYIDNSYLGKMALGAIELYNVTSKVEYYKDALYYGNLAGSDYWWSWGNINAYADFRIARYNRNFAAKIENNLKKFKNDFENNLFGVGAELKWGSNNTLLGITLQNILWKKLTNKSTYDTLAVVQRDFVLGRNPWGISFLYGIGANYTKNFHHQVSYFNNNDLPGGFAAGPVQKALLDSSKIIFNSKDNYLKFQTDNMYYRDDRNDYITNEPTISGNATAIFVFGNYNRKNN